MATNRYPYGLGIGAIMLAVTVLGAMVTPAVAGLSLDSLINKAVKKLPVKPGTGQVKVSLRIRKERGELPRLAPLSLPDSATANYRAGVSAASTM